MWARARRIGAMVLVVAAGAAAAIWLARGPAGKMAHAPGKRVSRIVVHARAKDGSRPIGARCAVGHDFSGRPLPESVTVTAPAPPGSLVTGEDGEWVVHNVPPGTWEVNVTSPDFADVFPANYQQVTVTEARDAVVAFELLRGGTILGKVVDGDTGKPLPRVQVGWGWAPVSSTTDARGRYTLQHVPPGKFTVQARSESHYRTFVTCPAIADEKTSEAPDIVMHAGGWIAGRLTLPAQAGAEPAEVPPPSVTVETDRGRSGRYWSVNELVAKDYTFRVGPLPPDSYRVSGSAGQADSRRASAQQAVSYYAAEKRKVPVRAGEVTEVHLVLQPKETSG